MACSSTVYKAHLNISDLDRGYYADHPLTIACHPSENEQRMMTRVLAFILHADPALQFGKGLSSQEEPALWIKNDNGEIELWIELGQPDEKRIRHACQRAQQVVIYSYQEKSAKVWWPQIKGKVSRFKNLHVKQLDQAMADSLTSLAKRGMKLQCTLQDGELWINDEHQQVHITPRNLSD